MKEREQREVKVGFNRNAKKVVDDIENIVQQMVAQGWTLVETSTDDVLEKVVLTFEREIFGV